MSDFKAKSAPKSNFSWRFAQTLLELSLQRSLDPLAGFEGLLLREGSGEEQMGRDGSGRKGRGWSVVESNNFLKIQYTLVKGAIAKSAVYTIACSVFINILQSL